MEDFKGKTVIVTEAAMGLGLSASRELASRGANVVLVDYNQDGLNKAKDEIAKEFTSARLLTVVADVSNQDAVRNYVDKAVAEFGSIEGLYNNAGIEGRQAGITEYDVSVFKK